MESLLTDGDSRVMPCLFVRISTYHAWFFWELEKLNLGILRGELYTFDFSYIWDVSALDT